MDVLIHTRNRTVASTRSEKVMYNKDMLYLFLEFTDFKNDCGTAKLVNKTWRTTYNRLITTLDGARLYS
jgi:hypothetical protein